MSPVELPVLQAAPAAAPAPAAAITRERYEQLAGQVRVLSWLSLAWMTVEGAVAIGAGLVASSIALVGFGLDSVVEGVASVVIIWRFSGHRVFSDAAEERARKLVAVQFFLLAPYVGFESVRALISGEHAAVSWVGIALAVGSTVFMPMLGIAKERLADQLGSAATKGEGRQNMLCAYLAGALLVGLLGNAVAGAWWLDPLVGLLIAVVAVREGLEAWRGEGCCAPVAAAPSCGLDRDGLVRQRQRYAEIGRSVTAVQRSPRRLVVTLADGIDRALVEHALSVERECCPFFDLRFEPDQRRLSIGVAADEMAPALDAIAFALGATESAKQAP